MESLIDKATFLAIYNAREGGDVYSVLRRLESKILDPYEGSSLRSFPPSEMALHMLCSMFSDPNLKPDINNGPLSLANTLQYALEDLAYAHFEKRQRHNVEGSASGDWDHAIDRVADTCYGTYHNSTGQRNVA